jgi:hypothetical protein
MCQVTRRESGKGIKEVKFPFGIHVMKYTGTVSFINTQLSKTARDFFSLQAFNLEPPVEKPDLILIVLFKL